VIAKSAIHAYRLDQKRSRAGPPVRTSPARMIGIHLVPRRAGFSVPSASRQPIHLGLRFVKLHHRRSKCDVGWFSPCRLGTDSLNIATVVLAPGQENPIKSIGFQASRSQKPLDCGNRTSSKAVLAVHSALGCKVASVDPRIAARTRLVPAVSPPPGLFTR
jgi:hypothetical protein